MTSQLNKTTLRAIVAGACIVQACSGQAKTELAFEAVSIKTSQADTNELLQTDKGLVRPAYHSFHYTPGHVTCTLPLITLIREAYGVKLWQVTGPAWLYDGAYDVAAIMPPETSKEQVQQMLQTMLRDRFRLKTHEESREVAVFALVAGKTGPKLTVAEPSDLPSRMINPRELKATQISMEGFADWLANVIPRPVIDMTELHGSYNIDLKYSPEYTDPTDINAMDVGLVSAIETQLGLKLNPTRLPFRIIVVDQARRVPTEN